MPRLTRMGSRTVQSGLYRMEELRANPQQLTAEVPSAPPPLRRVLSERAEPPHPHRPLSLLVVIPVLLLFARLACISYKSGEDL